MSIFSWMFKREGLAVCPECRMVFKGSWVYVPGEGCHIESKYCLNCYPIVEERKAEKELITSCLRENREEFLKAAKEWCNRGMANVYGKKEEEDKS